MSDCIFCKIANKEIPSNAVYEDDRILAFRDLSPVAPAHVLIITKEHIDSLDGLEPQHAELMGHLMGKVRFIASELGLEKGYRLVSNCGSEGGQTVGHLHFHLVGGRPMQWPPG